MSNNPVAKTEQSEAATIRALLDKSKSQIEAALPRHMNANKMLRVAMTAVQKTPKLMECHPVTLIGAVIQCAQLGLEPNDGTGQAWLIPFRNNAKNRMEVQFIAGYRGLVRLVRNSGEIGRFEARVVYEKDHFEFEYGSHPRLIHKPYEQGDPGQPTHFYTVAEFKDSHVQIEVMTKNEVDKIRARSKSANNGPWVTDYVEMGKKTVVRRAVKMLPVSTEAQKAATLDERADIGLPQDLGTLVDPTETGTPTEEPAPTFQEPKRIGAESAAPAEGAEGRQTFKIEGVSRTDREGKTVWIARRIGDGVKFYTDLDSVAKACEVAAKAGHEVVVEAETRGKELWIETIGKAETASV